jgi:guanylate kinase
MTSSCGRGVLFVLSAPSGTGKTTVVARLRERIDGLTVSRSYTSRPQRPGEVDGVDYHFVDRRRFESMIERDELLEWAVVFGNYYGTSRADALRVLDEGRDLMLVIDVQGGRQVRGRLEAVSIFLLPPSAAALEARLRGRNKDDEGAIRRRLEVARDEVAAYREYDYVVVNDDLDRCVDRLRAIVVAERCRAIDGRAVQDVLASFGIVRPVQS